MADDRESEENTDESSDGENKAGEQADEQIAADESPENTAQNISASEASDGETNFQLIETPEQITDPEELLEQQQPAVSARSLLFFAACLFFAVVTIGYTLMVDESQPDIAVTPAAVTKQIGSLFGSAEKAEPPRPEEALGLESLRQQATEMYVNDQFPRQKQSAEQVKIIQPLSGARKTVMSKQTPPLIRAAVKCKQLDVENLLDQGVNINVTDSNGDTAVAWAVRRRCAPVLDLLIKRGANVNTRANNGFTPHVWATTYSYKDLAKKLEAAGAETDISEKWAKEKREHGYR